ncbi:hypothetical protein E4U55_006126 [Claviceps digitariae]|nr:hypothetical protein E4U55_006126 [Claviceps digitariae]
MMLPFGTRLHPVVSFLFGTLQLAAVVHATPSLTESIGRRSREAPQEDELRTGVAVVGNYSGHFRPQIHYSPPSKFLNDPNGMFRDANGTWHLYYQHNPLESVAGHQHWGHATSPDLYHWTNQPIALYPPEDMMFVFSGSCVVDKNNTSGLFPNQTNGVVALYTVGDYRGRWNGIQQQEMAYSLDGGFTFIPYKDNPIIPSNSTQFRDPKVFWYEDHWVMTLVFADLFTVGIYTSPNLIDWNNVSNFTGYGIFGLQWECPNLIRMPYIDSQGDIVEYQWLLMIGINPRAQLGGSGTVYYTGSFNGTHYEAAQVVPRLADLGKDNYAGQYFYGQPEDEEPVYFGWASNWQYTQEVPTDQENWRSALTLPRRTHINKVQDVDWNLVQLPYDMSPIMGDTLFSGKLPINDSIKIDFSHIESNAVYWEVNVTGLPLIPILPKNVTFDFNFTNPETGEYLRGGHLFGGYVDFWLDRGGVRGFDDDLFADKATTTSIPINGTWSMSGVLDRSLWEVFVNGGEDSGTLSYFATKPMTVMMMRTSNLIPSIEGSVRVVGLKSAWEEMKGADGLVWGNQTKATESFP